MQFQTLIENVPGLPGVYQMFGDDGALLYVGKAKNLAARLRQYANMDKLPYNTKLMRSQVASIEIITTKTEAEALILESDLIKNKRPKYNILLTDDKMYPMMALSLDEYPRLFKFRGRANQKRDVFGPYSSVTALHESLKLIQKVCRLRTCNNSYMKNRTRPCLLNQIGRCSAPCMKGGEQYNDNVKLARRILSGDAASVIRDLSAQMDAASKNMDFEAAAEFRDKIRALSETAQRGRRRGGCADYFAGDFSGAPAIVIERVRDGEIISNQIIYPARAGDMSPSDIMEHTILWFYGNQEPETKIPIITNIKTDLLSSVLGPRLSVRENDLEIKKLLNQISLNRKVFGAREIKWAETVRELENWLGVKIDRADVFDNSHLFGTNPVGAMIVFGAAGFMKKEYRHYKLQDNARAGNDVGMMEEFLTRRYENGALENTLLIVDGGRTQWNVAKKVLKKLGLEIPVLGITKGEKRDGDESFIMPDGTLNKSLSKDSKLFLLLRAVRDEAHRFAITFHKKTRAKSATAGALDEIDGIGAARRRALLRHFGSVKGIADADAAALSKAPGISPELSKKIYLYFHPEID
ncbi:MAG: excinuclease ABC subunit UvrC [Alphaproteobacteria bacterium]|nr:excinuclease ABC subunit UvrC [Alphaproteobacteria bacterium]